MPFQFQSTPIAGLLVVQPRRFDDLRGFFVETYKRSEFRAAGIDLDFAQDNHSRSTRGVLRGLHFQVGAAAQGKLVRVSLGAIWDVGVDIRQDSPTRGQWYGLELSATNGTMLWLPTGFAHGFITLTDAAEVQYKCTTEYNRAAEAGYRWDDPGLAVRWPDIGIAPLVSDKDAALPRFSA